MRKTLILICLIIFPFAAWAQTENDTESGDKGFITNFLEEKLSGAGRKIVLDGFQGALSSRATFEQLTIADDQGIWLTLNDGAIQWNRSALLRGRVEIAELSAAEILLPRLPGSGKDEAPQAEATEFALPDLPVSLSIEKIHAGRVVLGEPVLGQAATISATGSMSLSDGEGQVDLSISRLDGPRGEFVLTSGYNNETKVLSLNLSLDEAADGLLVNLIDLHDKPAVTAQISGQGPLDSFTADLRLATDGLPRVTGNVAVNREESADGAPGRAFHIELSGDVASLLPPKDGSFFGKNTQLLAEGWRGDDGRLILPVLKINTNAMQLSGSVETNKQKAPQLAKLQILLGKDAGANQIPVKLPGGGEDTTVESGRLTLHYDADDGQAWVLDGTVGMLNAGAVAIGELALEGVGQVVLGDSGELSQISGKLNFGGEQIAFDDPGLAQAIGNAVTGGALFTYGDGQLEVSELAVNGEDYGLTGASLLSDLSGGLLLSMDLEAAYQDLSRLSALVGRPLEGMAEAKLKGTYTILTRAFDLKAQINGTEISLDQPQLDALLSGQSYIVLDAKRDETGIELRDLTIDAQELTAKASGYLNSESSDIKARLSLSSLAELGAEYTGSMVAEAQITGPAEQRQIALNADAENLAIGVDPLDRALQGKTDLDLLVSQVENGFIIRNLEFTNPQLGAEAEGNFIGGALDATAQVTVPDLSEIMPDWSGDLAADLELSEADGTRLLELVGKSQNLRIGNRNSGEALTGTTDLMVVASENSGVITLHDARLTNEQIDATAQGVYGEGVTDIAANLDVSTLAPLGAGWQGALKADVSLRETGTGARKLQLTGTGRDLSFGQAQVDGALAGETQIEVAGVEQDGVFTIQTAKIENPRLNASATGKLGGDATDITAQVNADDLRFLGNGFAGSVATTATLTAENGTRLLTAQGTANGLAVGQEQADKVLRGRTVFDLATTQSEEGLALQKLTVSNPQFSVSADGDPARSLNIQARLNDLALIQPGFPGPVVVDGTLGQSGPNFTVDLDADAPGSTDISINGTAARDLSTADIAITGNTDAGVANSFIRTRSVEGPVTLNLRVDGPPSLNSLSGRVALRGGNLAEPSLGIRMEGVDLTADLQNGRILLDGAGNIAAGGRILLSGPVNLRNGTIDIGVTLDNVVARDPNLYETRLSGNVNISGRMADAPLISGTINVGETEIRIPSTGLGGAKTIPDINHVGDRRPARATRAKAGLEPFGSEASEEAGLGGPPATPPANPPRLDLMINAPRQIFIRGRGVDAEMGGSIQIRGTTRNAVPIGHLGLIRGRIDLLGKRFILSEGSVDLQGSLSPVIRLVAQNEQDGITTRIIIDGEVSDPEINFESSPDMPEEEVLSQLLFGRGLENISPLQAAQLADAIAVLAGRGGDSIVSQLRNQVGLDDLDLATDDEGNVQVRAGKYLSENVYTDVAIGDDGKSTLNLNLDVSKTVRARGSVASDGESTVGIYFERDY